jgi:hydroxyacylglutathione hydrolase
VNLGTEYSPSEIIQLPIEPSRNGSGSIEIWIARSRIYETNSGIIISGSKVFLIDPGVFPGEIQYIRSFVINRNLSIQAILLTHSHWDHILGPEQFPGIPIMAQALFSKEAQNHREELIREISSWEHTYNLFRRHLFVIPQPDITFENELEIAFGGFSLKLLSIPGHSADQCAIYIPAHKVLWAADTLSDLEIPLVDHSLQAYRQTITTLSCLEIQALIPGHGHPTNNSNEIKARLDNDQAYLETLNDKINASHSQGLSLEETLRICSEIPYRQSTDNYEPHLLNIQGAYHEALHHRY